MTDFSMTHAAGVRTFASYTVPEVAAVASVQVLPDAGGGFSVLGDLLDAPQPFVVTVFVEADGTLASAYEFAYAVIAEAESATSITTHWGVVPVDGILGYRMQPDVLAVRLTLEFMPAGALIAPAPTGGAFSSAFSAAFEGAA